MSTRKRYNVWSRWLLTIGISACILLGVVTCSAGFWGSWTISAAGRTISAEKVVHFESLGDQSDKYIYLSDMTYLPSSKSGYGSFLKDEAARISLQHEGATVSFPKGLWAHATSNLDYDLREYQDYDYFTTFYGVNNTSNQNGSVKFYFYVSDDAQNWRLVSEENPVVMRKGMAAGFVKIPIKGVNYLRLVADKDGSNANDHAVYGDAKLIKDSYRQYAVPSVDELDAEIKSQYSNTTIEASPDYEMEVLRRNFVKGAGQYALTTFIEESVENREVLNWLYNDLDTMRMYTTGGKPSGSYLQSLRALTELYEAYSSDMNDRTRLKTTAGTRGELYKKMMITISLTHSQQVRFWVRDQGEMAGNASSPNISSPVKRYAVYKRMYLADKLVDTIFESLEVEEMRYLMATELGDDEIEWLNDYLTAINKPNYAWPPVPYISIGNHYWFDSNYAAENQQKWNDKYHLIGSNYLGNGDYSLSGNYKIGFEKYAPHLWMVMEHGGVCWQISNTGQNMVASRGIPSTTLGQPGHVAFANYEVKNGVPIWALTNDVSGWQQTNFTGYTNTQTYHQVRQLNNWGARDNSYLNINRFGYQGSYIVMAQAALNDFENYEKSQELTLSADIYGDDLAKQERLYREALQVQNINFDAWTGLVRTYMADESKTAEDYYNLAKEMAGSLKLYPVPFYDLMQAILSEVPVTAGNVSASYNAMIEMLLTNTLKEAAKVPDQVYDGRYNQAGVTRTMANYLLGRLNNEVAKFSFDGDEETAGYLKLGAKYENSSAAWEFSLDGGRTWLGQEGGQGWVTDKSIKLTTEQIKSITAENDILVHIQGVPRSEENIYVIDITAQEKPSNLYANDNENRVIGVSTYAEWRYNDGEAWKAYRDEMPVLSGDASVQVRNGATGTKLASDYDTYSFTVDTDTDERHYVPVAHLSIAGVSSQATAQGRPATNAIDGNIHTNWHSAWNGTDTERFITIKFDHDVDLRAVEYYQGAGGNGKILDGTLYGSMDGETWETLQQVKDWKWSSNDAIEYHTFELETPVRVRYVKIVADKASNGNWFVARMFNFYEDLTNNPRLTAGVDYSTTEPTSGQVVARLVNPSEPISITNNDGKDTYIFNDNGEFTFEFEGKNSGQKGQVTARVDWIQHDAPVGRIVYGCVKDDMGDMDEEIDCSGARKVNRSVTARLVFDEDADVTILNNGVQTRSSDDNQSSDQDSLDPFTYLFMENGEFIFEYVDKAGNRGAAVARVDWIDKVAPVAKVEYSTTSETTGRVTARLVKTSDEDEDFVVINNNGSDVYHFVENGEFMFEFRDEAGNRAATTARVDWITKSEERPDDPGDPDDDPSNPDDNPVGPVGPGPSDSDDIDDNIDEGDSSTGDVGGSGTGDVNGGAGDNQDDSSAKDDMSGSDNGEGNDKFTDSDRLEPNGANEEKLPETGSSLFSDVWLWVGISVISIMMIGVGVGMIRNRQR